MDDHKNFIPFPDRYPNFRTNGIFGIYELDEAWTKIAENLKKDLEALKILEAMEKI